MSNRENSEVFESEGNLRDRNEVPTEIGIEESAPRSSNNKLPAGSNNSSHRIQVPKINLSFFNEDNEVRITIFEVSTTRNFP